LVFSSVICCVRRVRAQSHPAAIQNRRFAQSQTDIAMAVGARWWHQSLVIRRQQTVAELMALEAV